MDDLFCSCGATFVTVAGADRHRRAFPRKCREAAATIATKVRHVLNAPADRRHTCHWPGCKEIVSPARWGCRPHWYKLPWNIRNDIWRAYAIGQESGAVSVSPIYIAVAKRARAWIREHYPETQKEIDHD